MDTCRRSTFAPPYLGLKRPAMNCSSGSATGFRRRVLSAAREAAGPWECETVADDAVVRIRLLGGFEVTVGDRLVAADAWRLRKAKTLVKLLVLAAGHRIHREALVGVLWPERDAASASNNLHQALFVARRVLAGAPGGMCCLRDDVVLLSEGPAPWLDTEAFDATCRRARRRAPDGPRTAPGAGCCWPTQPLAQATAHPPTPRGGCDGRPPRPTA